jgi:LysR family hydrogen peroxide-inducible transcriptional activator
MVSGGVGITLLPSMAVPTEVFPRDAIVVRSFGGRPPGRTIGLAWRKSSARRREFEMLADLLRSSPPRGVTAV